MDMHWPTQAASQTSNAKVRLAKGIHCGVLESVSAEKVDWGKGKEGEGAIGQRRWSGTGLLHLGQILITGLNPTDLIPAIGIYTS